MYEFPFGAGQQLNLNWIINEIITLHTRLDPDYELPNFDNAFPYMNLNQLNLDWILRELKAIKDLAPTEDSQLLKMVANALIANTYDATTQYNVDDIVYRDSDNRLYKCITATPAGGEPFDSSKWVEVDVGGVLTDLLNNVVIPPEPYGGNPAMDGTASAGTSTQYARGDHVHPKDTARVPTSRTVNGKALSSNITLNASDIPNDSNVTGDNVDDALNNLNTAITSEVTARQNADTAIQEQITANIETSTTASKAYSTGDFLILNGVLYKVKTSIASGATLTIGTNIESTTITASYTKVTEETCFASTNPTNLSAGSNIDITLNYPNLSYIGFVFKFYSTATAQSAHAASLGEFRAVTASDHTALFYMDGQIYTITYALNYSNKKFSVVSFNAPNLYVHRIYGIVVN